MCPDIRAVQTLHNAFKGGGRGNKCVTSFFVLKMFKKHVKGRVSNFLEFSVT